MRKFIMTALAAGALAAGSAASAQGLGGFVANVFGVPTPAVVAGAQPMYTDAYGRQFYYDQYGRQVFMNTVPQQIVGYDQWGRPVYGTAQYGGYAYNNSRRWDRDGDGVPNNRDRWPDDPRYR